MSDPLWNCTVLSPSGDIELEQVDHAGAEWLGLGPGGEAIGAALDVLAATAADGTDPGWIQAVAAALQREVATGERRAALVVKRGVGVWFHVTFASNRQSIQRQGLDWRFMTGQGIAGSAAPEWPGIFLCESIEDAQFFVRIGAHRGPVDVWSVELDGQWLEGAPAAAGGDNWMIWPSPIPARTLHLLERDLPETEQHERGSDRRSAARARQTKGRDA